MPFDIPEETQDETAVPPGLPKLSYPFAGAGIQPLPYPRLSLNGIPPANKAMGLNQAANTATRQPDTPPKLSFAQRIAALGEYPFSGTFSSNNQNAGGASRAGIGHRILANASATIPPAKLSQPVRGTSSATGLNNGQRYGEFFSEFVPAGADPSRRSAPNLESRPLPFATARFGQGISQYVQSGKAALAAQKANVTNASMKPNSAGKERQVTQSSPAPNTNNEKIAPEFEPPSFPAPPVKIKPPQPGGPGDWSGGEADRGERIINPGYHTDYSSRGKRKIGGNRGWRNNNPANIVYSRSSPASQNAVGHDYGGFAIFDTMQDGIKAQDILWHTQRYQNMTLEQAVKSWTSGDPRRIQEAYLQDLMGKTGANRNTKISSLTESQIQDLEQAQRQHEGSQKGRIVDIPKPKPSRHHK